MGSIKDPFQLFLSLDLPHQQAVEQFSSSGLKFRMFKLSSVEIWDHTVQGSVLGRISEYFLFQNIYFRFFFQNFRIFFISKYIFSGYIYCRMLILTIIISSYVIFILTQIIFLLENDELYF